MKSLLHILHLEDNLDDAEIVHSLLLGAGIRCSIKVVQTRADLLAALGNEEVDLILSDFALPGFDGMEALEIVRSISPDVPFIFVSGNIGEEAAIESLKSGATDYVLKTHFSRLVPSVLRAMKEVDSRAERKRLAEQVIQSQKMEVFGQLAGGIAHDFNNILGVIMGYSEILLSKLHAEDPLYQFTEEIKEAGEQGAALTRQLLVFSRDETMQPVVLELNEVVKGVEKMLRRLIHENIELTVRSTEQAGPILGDPGYIGQVLMNLVVNARDAMPNGGSIVIETANVNLDSGIGDVPAGDYALLKVSDTGTGMTEEVKAHIFEAFFTTKPKGKGTGLGLATCRMIVQQSGGHIVVESVPGRGTTFYIYFPRVRGRCRAAIDRSRVGPLPRGTETILFVEDDRFLRQLTLSVLAGQGYHMLSASNGQEGLSAAREHTEGTIALVVTDVIMPQMSGPVMVDWLKANCPDIKVLFTSGYTDDAIAHHGVLDPGLAFLPKPYTPAVLIQKVREMLDS